MARQTTLPTATLLDTLGFVINVAAPTIAKGVVIRRQRIVGLVERLGLDSRAVRYMQHLRRKYRGGPLVLRAPIQTQAVILSPQDVHTVLDHSPEPFAVAARLKRSALNHFEPKNVLVSHGAERAERRRFNEEALDFHSPVHRAAADFIAVVEREAETILEAAGRDGELHWDAFADGWFRLVRTVVFGPSAREDVELTAMVDALRGDANWAFARPKRKQLRAEFLARVKERLARAEPGSLAAVIANLHTTDVTEPHQQVPQWLFAFDPAGMATYRALALLASHPQHLERARSEIAADGSERRYLPFLRACVLEALRLWPTAPMILRETTRPTDFETGTMPAKTGVLVYSPFFHRDDENLAYAHAFTPDVWLGDGIPDNWPLVPFSDGPGACPGRQLVLLLTSAMLAALIEPNEIRLKPANRLRPDKPLPGTLNNYGLRFDVRPLAR